MKALAAALRFLTIVPIPGDCGAAESDLARSIPLFPLVGVLLGGVAAAIGWVLSLFAPPMLSAALLVIVLLSFSGCLHLDGLADTADGFLSSRPRERILEIMRDSSTGAMGVAAIVCVLLVKFASLASLPKSLLWPALLLMPVAGRSAMVVEMALLPYARPSGLGAVFCGKKPRWSAIWSAVILAALACGLLQWRGLIVWAACMAATLVLSAYAYRKIGGATGDTFGAVCEIVEVVPALVLAFGPLGGAR